MSFVVPFRRSKKSLNSLKSEVKRVALNRFLTVGLPAFPAARPTTSFGRSSPPGQIKHVAEHNGAPP